MHIWGRFLAEASPMLQRLIARTQRVSLPRQCTAHERQRRLRRALCRPATVRSVYQSLDAPTQTALQTLRQRRGGINPATLGAQYGVLRSWRALAADPRPQSVAERLVLLGWLMPRTRKRSDGSVTQHFLLPPELRRWLPTPLALPSYGVAPAAPPALALRIAATLLLLSAERPLRVRQDGMLQQRTLRTLNQRLPEVPEAEVGGCMRWLTPLACEQGWLLPGTHGLTIAVAGQRWLALPAAAQAAALKAAWLQSPTPDAWLRRMVDTHGMDWPVFRRRVCAWVAALPAQQLLDPDLLYPNVARALGPLADAHTHGFRTVKRVPWQPRRAGAVWLAALHGPLQWLGLAAWHDIPGQRMVACGGVPETPAAPLWRLGAPGAVYVPHTQASSAVLRLLPFVTWVASDAEGSHYQATSQTLARAIRHGADVTQFWAMLAHHATAAPDAWRTALEHQPPHAVVQAALLLRVEPPEAFTALQRHRTVRRHLVGQLTPTVARVENAHVAPLVRALERHGVVVVSSPTAPPAEEAPTGLSVVERDALQTALRFYAQHAPPDAPQLPIMHLLTRLGSNAAPPDAPAALPTPPQTAPRMAAPPLHLPPSHPLPAPATSAPQLRQLLTHAIRVERAVLLCYTPDDKPEAERLVQPLALEQRGTVWYLRAFCTLRQAERTFRLDRIRHATKQRGACASAPLTDARRRDNRADPR